MRTLLLVCLIAGCPRGGDLGRRDSDRPVRLYEVQWGDSLWEIATYYDVPGGYRELAALNGIRNPAYIEAGAKIRVPTYDDTLPAWPRVSRESPDLHACASEPLPAATPRGIAGCEAAACVDVGGGAQACACDAPSGRRLALFRGGAVAWLAPVEAREVGWFDPDTAPASAGIAATLQGFRTQLDEDPAPEIAVAWRQEENDLGMSRWEVALFDEPVAGRPPVSFEAANWGPGSVVNAAGGGCEVLATEWILADEASRQRDGWYLVARRMRYATGGLRVVPGSSLVARRLLDGFHPGARDVAGVRVGTPHVDLARALARSTDPAVELPVAGLDSGTIAAARRTPEGLLALEVRATRGATTEVIDPDAGPVRRLGDPDTGLLYPPGYVPADLAGLAGRPVTITSYQPPWWGEPWSVAWIRS